MTRTITALVLCLLAQAGLAQDSVETDAKEFKPPRGFQTKKRGDLVLYCKRDSTIGTRFKTEKCYDEKQMREYMLALEMQKNDVDRIRATCGGGTTCNLPDPTRQ